MTLRKNFLKENQSPPPSQRNLFPATSYKSSQKISNLLKLGRQQLIYLIEEKQRQNKQLLKMLFQYKTKITEFEKYQALILELKKQSNVKQVQNRFKNEPIIKNTEDTLAAQCQKIKSRKISKCCHSASFSIMIYSQKIKNLLADQKQNLTDKNFLMETCSANSQNSKVPTSRGGNSSYFYSKGFKNSYLQNQCSKLNMTFDQNRTDQSRQLTTRVPSLDNLRRIKNCYKLLKKSDQLLGHRYQVSGF